MKRAVYFLVGALLGLSSPAFAGTLSIDFELGQSQFLFDASPGLLRIGAGENGDSTGHATLTLTGVDAAGNPLDPGGSIQLTDLSLLFLPALGSPLAVSGSIEFRLELSLPVVGRRVSDGFLLEGERIGAERIDLSCVGASVDCARISAQLGFAIPITIAELLVIQRDVSLSVMGIDGVAAIAGTIGGTGDIGGTLEVPVFAIGGREVRRSFVPEPPQLGLFCGGAAFLLLLAYARSRGPV